MGFLSFQSNTRLRFGSNQLANLTISSTVQMWSVIPAAIAGVLGQGLDWPNNGSIFIRNNSRGDKRSGYAMRVA